MSDEITHILAVDCEVSGMNFFVHSLLEMGAAVIEVETGNVVSQFHRYFGIENVEWQEDTKKEFWDNPKHGDGTKTPLELMVARGSDSVSKSNGIHDFVEWAREIDKNLPDKHRIVVVSDTAGFDYSWISFHMSDCFSRKGDAPSLDYLFGKWQSVKEITSFYRGILRDPYSKSGKESFLAAFADYDIPQNVREPLYDHNPKNDATFIAVRAAYAIKQIQNEAKKKKRPAPVASEE